MTDNQNPRIAIIGSGPTGLYTLAALVERGTPCAIDLFEKGDRAGVGMPYNDADNIRLMLANIASIEIPPIGETYLDWIRRQPRERLRRFGVDPARASERAFYPRVMLGEYFRDQYLWLAEQAEKAGLQLTVYEQCEVADIAPVTAGLLVSAPCFAEPQRYDRVVIATGHVWPDASEATRSYFPSPWSGLVDATIPATRVGILGTSLSAIDAAMAVATQHGSFTVADDGEVTFQLDAGSEPLSITLMSRTGILPEADFYCPIPYEPLEIATAEAIAQEIAQGPDGLLDRVFALATREIVLADPAYAERIRLDERTADDLDEAYFADRKRHDPFAWAEYNLAVVERNKAERHTVAWRYAILRLHEVVQEIVPHLSEIDRERFEQGLRNVFVDNYAAVPSQSIRRLLALRQAGVIKLLDMGYDYNKRDEGGATVIEVDGNAHRYDVFIDARGQRPLSSADLPFPSLAAALAEAGEDIPDVDEDYALLAPESVRGRIAFGALPYLIHDNPFIQGITASSDIGRAIGMSMPREQSRPRRRLPFLHWD